MYDFGTPIVLDKISLQFFSCSRANFNGSFKPVCNSLAYFVQNFFVKNNLFRLVTVCCRM